MRSLLLTSILASSLISLAGCNLYFSGGDDPDPCDEWGGGSGDGLAEPVSLLRNPETGACEDWGWGGGGPWPCDSECGPCAGSGSTGGGGSEPTPVPLPEPGDEPTDSGADREAPGGAQAPPPTWGSCDSYCTGLDEQTCLATDRCRGIYEAGTGGPGLFRECWATDTEDWGFEECEGLNAQACSTSDRCVAVHEFNCDDGGPSDPNGDGFVEPGCTPGFFLSCHDEPGTPDGCYGNEDCDDGFSCNAADICLPPPGSGNGDQPVPTVCYGYCVPDNVDPGECDGEVLCESLPPLCEAGTTPGIANGCWTGLCIPLEECPDFACSDIEGESMCIAREDCSAYYVGDDCVCDQDGCTCADWLFDSCGDEAP